MQQPARRRLAFRCLLAAGSLLLALLLAEAVVRLMGEVDADGNFFFRGQQVGRRFPPASSVAETLREYRGGNSSRMIYDAETGWKPRPHVSTHGGNYRYNAAGIRSAPQDYTLEPAAGTVRIALFGDSFTHGDDVHFDDTWGAQLEQMLNDRGVRVEVVNFGVSAYGMDQAYLRWQTLGRRYRPHVVLFGFQAENVNRNVNLLRAFYAGGTGIPFSKPRFVLADGGDLRLINSPTLPLETIPAVMADMPSWELAEYEAFYDPSQFERRLWHFSRFASLAVEVLFDERPRRRIDPYRLDSEPARVTLALLREFRRDVEATGAQFLIVHLPIRSDVTQLVRSRPLAYRQLLERVAAEQALIDPALPLLAAAQAESVDAVVDRHYTPEGNRVIARTIADDLLRRAGGVSPVLD